MTSDFWVDAGEDRTKPLLSKCSEDGDACSRLIIPADQFDLYPREVIMTCPGCFQNFLVNLKISAKVREMMPDIIAKRDAYLARTRGQ